MLYGKAYGFGPAGVGGALLLSPLLLPKLLFPELGGGGTKFGEFPDGGPDGTCPYFRCKLTSEDEEWKPSGFTKFRRLESLGRIAADDDPERA
jgi:hypothetical protein